MLEGMSSVFVLLVSQVVLPGTQPNELTILPEPSSNCGCHDAFDPFADSEPAQSYKATPMALAARDPIFRAALEVANQDRPGVTDLCLRCHTPRAWLSGRSSPGDASALEPEDLESVTCDICHRMIPTDPPLIGDAQMTMSPLPDKRAQRGVQGMAVHMVQQSDYQQTSELCGLCHSLFNPAEDAHGPDGTNFNYPYYEQRTYEEWADSAFNTNGVSCIDCHMDRVTGVAARNGNEYPDLAVHRIVGGNWFVPQAVHYLSPNLGLGGELDAMDAAIQRSLQDAVSLSITSTIPPNLTLASDESFTFDLRVTNETGHKLPTGYPEGRRVYLEVALHFGTDTTVVSGFWDPNTGNLVPDPQLRTYETEHGRYEAGTSTPTHHIVFANQIISDTRIPPEGFSPSSPDMVPSGRDYGSTTPFNHWDDVSFTIDAPQLTEATTGTVTVRAMHQITDGNYVRFLLDTAAGSTAAANLEAVWEALGHAPPREMKRISFELTVEAAPIPDAGFLDTGIDTGVTMDTGVSDAGITDTGTPDTGTEPEPEEGCGCSSTAPSAPSWPLILLLLQMGTHTIFRRKKW